MKPSDTGSRTEDDRLLETAWRAAEAAADLHTEWAGALVPDRWDEKGTADFVTEVDREAERRILAILRERFPDHGLLAEEGTEGELSQAVAPGIRWIVDPLDGTTNWLHGYPEYAVSLAAIDEEGLRVGVVLNSATGERFDAIRGRGSRRNGREIHVSSVAELRLALVGTGFPFKRPELLPTYLETLDRVLRATSGVRRSGSAALDLCDLACGRLDAFWELWLMPWDVAAGVLVVREAGGVVEAFPEPVRTDVPPLVREVSQGAGAFLALGSDAGGEWPGPGGPRAGAYVAVNGPLLDPFRRLVEP